MKFGKGYFAKFLNCLDGSRIMALCSTDYPRACLPQYVLLHEKNMAVFQIHTDTKLPQLLKSTLLIRHPIFRPLPSSLSSASVILIVNCGPTECSTWRGRNSRRAGMAAAAAARESTRWRDSEFELS